MSKNELIPFGQTDIVIKGYESAMADASATTQEGGGWSWVGLKDQVFRLTPNAPAEKELDVIVVAAMRANLHRHPYVEGKKNVSTPICYAFQERGKGEEEMTPPADWPTRVHGKCFDCHLNAWGSGRGNAKECSNQVHLAVLPTDSLSPEVLGLASGRRVAVSPTGLRGWSEYVNLVQGQGLPLFALETKLYFEGKTMRFAPIGVLPSQEAIDAVYSRYEEAWKALSTGYKKPGEGTDPTPAPRTRTVKRASGAAKRRATPRKRK